MKASRFTIGAACAAAVFAVNAKAQDEVPAAAQVVIFAAPAQAGGTLAESNYAYGGIGLFSYGDKFSGTGFALEGGANFNVIPQLDIVGSLRYYTASKNSFTWSELDIGGDAYYWFLPKEQINPYAGGGLFLANYSWELDVWGYKISDSETKAGLKLFGGAEFDAAPELTLRAGLTIKFISDYNDIIFDALCGYNVTDELVPYGKFEYWFDSGNVVFIAGAMFKF